MSITPYQDPGLIRRVLAFAKATGAPPEALSWMIRMARQAQHRRAAGPYDLTVNALAAQRRGGDQQ
jgi:hypothetical protein